MPSWAFRVFGMSGALVYWCACLTALDLRGFTLRLTTAAIFALLVPLVAVQAAIFTVPGSALTIQGAIDLAASGDTIRVSPGTYFEAIDFLGKNLSLTSVGGASVTTIVAPAMTPVIQFVNGEDRGATLSGFTLSGGRPGAVAPYFGDGGGIYVENSSPTISNNVITANIGCNGGGISVRAGAPLIVQNTISDNRADCSQLGSSSLWSGGGIYLTGASATEISGNYFFGNISDSGSAIGMNGGGAFSIHNNNITGNISTDTDCTSFVGGTIWMDNFSNPDIVNNVIADNIAACNGGVVFLVPSGARGPALVNNTFVFNSGSTSSGIFAAGYDNDTRIINNLILSKADTVAMSCSDIFAQGSPVVENNLFYSGGGVSVSAICGNQIGINGNQAADPRLVAPGAGDYHLMKSSPAIDAGLGSESLIPPTDFDGAPRVQDGNGDGISQVDIGAFEAPLRIPSVATPIPTLSPWGLVYLAGFITAAQVIYARRRRT